MLCSDAVNKSVKNRYIQKEPVTNTQNTFSSSGTFGEIVQCQISVTAFVCGKLINMIMVSHNLIRQQGLLQKKFRPFRLPFSDRAITGECVGCIPEAPGAWRVGAVSILASSSSTIGQSPDWPRRRLRNRTQIMLESLHEERFRHAPESHIFLNCTLKQTLWEK